LVDVAGVWLETGNRKLETRLGANPFRRPKVIICDASSQFSVLREPTTGELKMIKIIKYLVRPITRSPDHPSPDLKVIIAREYLMVLVGESRERRTAFWPLTTGH
jgi:hypothetical protein